jgi:hypothetical protein
MHALVRRTLLVAVVAALASLAAAQEKPAPCTAPEYRQFDFWLGEWDVYSGDQIVGTNSIQRVQGQCALLENWTDTYGNTGMSLNFFDRSDRLWHQTWIGQGGGALFLKGEFKDGKMVLSSEPGPGPNGTTVVNRITWTPLDGGKVRQLWESTADGGKTWTVAFDGTYVKRAAGAPALQSKPK